MNLQTIEALVFDMDGLIFDSEKVVQRSWNIVGEELGYPKLGEHIYNTIGFNITRRREYFMTALGEDFPFERFAEGTRVRFQEIAGAEGIALKPGVRELLQFARHQGLKTAVATSSRERHAAMLLKEANLYDWFDGFIYGDQVTEAKPAPEIYQKACAIIGVSPEHSIALEDSPAGIQSAHAAGMYPIMVPDLVQPSPEIQGLLYKQFGTLGDVWKWLEGGLGEGDAVLR